MTDTPPLQVQDATAPAQGQFAFNDSYTEMTAHLRASNRASYDGHENFDPVITDEVYRGKALARKIVSIVAEDATKNGRAWQSDNPAHIKAIEAEEARLGFNAKLMVAAKFARAYGGAAIFIGQAGVKREGLINPLDPKMIAKGGIESLSVIRQSELHIPEFDEDITSPYYEQPKHFELNAKIGSETSALKIHPSRLVVLKGEDRLIQSFAFSEENFWGDSVLVGLLEHIDRAVSGQRLSHTLLFEAKNTYLMVEGLLEDLQQDPTYRGTMKILLGDMALTARTSDVVALDAAMEVVHNDYNFTGIPPLIQEFNQFLAAVCDIPYTRLFETSAKGMNATGEGDMKNYIAMIRAWQTHRLQPALAILDQCLIRSATGGEADLTNQWRNLYDPTIKEQMEMSEARFKMLREGVDDGIITPEDAQAASRKELEKAGLLEGSK